MKRNAGFTTVYLLMILSSLVAIIVVTLTVASGYAARSITDTICASAGRSVLSEYQKDLYRRYGVFALKGDEAVLTRLAEFYIEGSMPRGKAVVKPETKSITASSEAYPALDVKTFSEQIRRLAPGAVLTKGGILEYIMSNADSGPTGLVKEIVQTAEGEEVVEEVEEAVSNPSQTASDEFGKDSDEKGGSKIPSVDVPNLPSRLLGYHPRISALLSGGVKDISFAMLVEDEYIMALCGNKVKGKGDTFLKYEVEYIIYGSDSDASNLRRIKLSLFSIRMAVNEAKYYAETGEVLVATVQAVAKSVSEVRKILAGEKVDKLGYETYIRILLALIPREEKMARLMDVMQLNITKVDGSKFSFRNYAYGFDLNAVFELKGRDGDVSYSFKYQ